MSTTKKAKSALISVFHKDGLEAIVKKLDKLGITIYSTGGTEKFILNLGINVVPVEDLTSYPSILGGRVKTLHPKVFGGLLGMPDKPDHANAMESLGILPFDLIAVNLYPFEKVIGGKSLSDEELVEFIDIGGVALLRAAAKILGHKADEIVDAQREGKHSGPLRYSGVD